MPPNVEPNVGGTVNERRGEHRSVRRVHISEAAEILGVSKDAVRMRVKRGTLRSEKGENGRVYVWVNDVPDTDANGVHEPPGSGPYRELVEELRDRVRSLEDANRENRRIIAALTQRIPEIEAPASPLRESPVSAEPDAPTDTPAEGHGGRQEATGSSLRTPWWRRLFGEGG